MRKFFFLLLVLMSMSSCVTLEQMTITVHIPEHTRSLSGSLLGYKTIP